MYKVKIFFGSFYGEWFENDFLEDMDWSDISVAECMIEAHFGSPDKPGGLSI